MTSTRPAPSDEPIIIGVPIAALERDAHGVRVRVVAERRLLEPVVEPFALGDLERVADPLVVGAEAHQPADDRLVGAVAFTGAGERAVQLDRARSGVPPTRPRASSPSRHAPAVCDDDGPTMTGPMMSSSETMTTLP